jgi:uroporphyrinogen III methyltransferase/synthase
VVVVTRSAESSAAVRELFETSGAEVILVPAIRHVAAEASSPGARLLVDPERFSHVVFTSQTAVRFFFEIIAGRAEVVERWRECRAAAVGPKTAGALEDRGWPRARIGVVGVRGGAALAGELLAREGLGPHHRVLLPQSSIARSDLADLLAAAGVPLTRAAIYDTESEDPSRAAPFLDLLSRGRPPDAVTFFSPSAVDGFLEMTGDAGREALAARSVSIGAMTSAALRAAGIEPAAEATAPTAEAVVAAVVRALS